jgi:hypothetical protein
LGWPQRAHPHASPGLEDGHSPRHRHDPRATKVHRGPSAKGYASAVEVRPSRKLTAVLKPSIALKLADLGIA